ncbi:hypothetical protein L1987_48814 [Smallanthus sonchifolius]|uniref:Uncharacterized protein n=1 Tax=Smallanthus sonchifolius TaxID=185202 RepID=A0ACB9FU33_9ASTR|nr:hypothetical protein L1987_48814 [Smallanthus sonchifolius]
MPAVTTLLQFTFRCRIQPFDSSSSSMGNRFCNQFTSFFSGSNKAIEDSDRWERGRDGCGLINMSMSSRKCWRGRLCSKFLDVCNIFYHSLYVVECDQVIKAMVIILEPVVLNMVGLPMRQGENDKSESDADDHC